MGTHKIRSFFSSGRFLYHLPLALTCWISFSVLGFLQRFLSHKINNYLIYRQVFFHLIHQTNLYQPYPAEYYDVNLYGPVFAILILPFSLLPVSVGVWCWVLANVAFLGFAIWQLPLQKKWRIALLLLCSHELMINSAWVQTNALVAACLLLGFAYVQKQREYAALFFILLSAFIKIYGIVGLSFFFFSRHPVRFVMWTIVWSLTFFLAPLLLTSFSFLWQTYQHWGQALVLKSNLNTEMGSGDVLYQNISVMGMIRRIFYLPHMNDLWVFVPAFLLLLSQGASWNYFKDIRLQLYLLCSLLLFVVIFSNSAESPTYIIALPAICIWYLMQPKTKKIHLAFTALFVFTTFAYSDLFGSWLRSHLFRPYSLKALPSFILWLIILVQVHRRQFLKTLFPWDKKSPHMVAVR